MDKDPQISPFIDTATTQEALTPREQLLRVIGYYVADNPASAFKVLKEHRITPKGSTKQNIAEAIADNLHNIKFTADLFNKASNKWNNEGQDPYTAAFNLVDSIFSVVGGKQQLKLEKEKNKGLLIGFVAQKDNNRTAQELAIINATSQAKIARERRMEKTEENRVLVQAMAGGAALIIGIVLIIVGVKLSQNEQK